MKKRIQNPERMGHAKHAYNNNIYALVRTYYCGYGYYEQELVVTVQHNECNTIIALGCKHNQPATAYIVCWAGKRIIRRTQNDYSKKFY